MLKVRIIISLSNQVPYYGDSHCQCALANGAGPPVWLNYSESV